MKITETKPVTALQTVTLSTSCDICGRSVPEHEDGCMDEVVIKATAGDVDRDGHADYKVTEFDLCLECFHHRLLSWMRRLHGRTPRVTTHYGSMKTVEHGKEAIEPNS